jgi:NAD(P)-dependent dehydrogenase (short-subunit alcohol dehydrogenase family)
VQTDVRNWADLTKLFKAAQDKHGRIDYVFANAGIGPRADYLSLKLDANGDPEQPNKDTLDINFSSVVDTVTLGAHFLKTQPEGGSIVIMGSSTGLHPVRAVDYCTHLTNHTSHVTYPPTNTPQQPPKQASSASAAASRASSKSQACPSKSTLWRPRGQRPKSCPI